jgi:hypothetical protein
LGAFAAQGRVRQGCEPFGVNLFSAALALPIAASFDLFEGLVNFREMLLAFAGQIEFH